MEGLLDIAPCGYLSFRDDGEILWVNETLSRWLGYPKTTLVGKRVDFIFTTATRIFYNTHLFPLLKLHERADEIFLSLVTRENEDLPVLINAVRRQEAGVSVNHCVFIPVHQRKKFEAEILAAKRDAENALKENTQLKEITDSLEAKTLELDRHYQKQISITQNLVQFSKIVSHDLQEPLRKIDLFADMIFTEHGHVFNARSTSALKKIESAVARLRVLTNGLHQYVSVESEQLFTAVDLVMAVRLGASKAMELRKFEDFDLTVEDLPSIQGYKNQLELLFYHLIDNSIQFRAPERKLSITISSVAVDENVFRLNADKYKFTEHVKVIYTDNGIGIDMKFKEYIFDLLKKIDPAMPGLGIGLPLVKKIVDNHSGLLAVESIAGNGIKFILTLPVNLADSGSS
jgi:phosphoserine phosphatase RsbU/P